MNIFRLAGDMTHLLSIVVLLLKIHATKSCAGESHTSLPLNLKCIEAVAFHAIGSTLLFVGS